MIYLIQKSRIFTGITFQNFVNWQFTNELSRTQFSRSQPKLAEFEKLSSWKNWFSEGTLFAALYIFHDFYDCMFYHVTNTFQSESTLYSCMNVAIECVFTLKRVRDIIRTYNQVHRTDKYSQQSSIIWPVWLNHWMFFYKLSNCVFEPWFRLLKLQISHLFRTKFLDIQATRECVFTLKRACDMVRTYNQMHRTDIYSQHSLIIWPGWLNGWVFVYG